MCALHLVMAFSQIFDRNDVVDSLCEGNQLIKQKDAVIAQYGTETKEK